MECGTPCSPQASTPQQPESDGSDGLPLIRRIGVLIVIFPYTVDNLVSVTSVTFGLLVHFSPIPLKPRPVLRRASDQPRAFTSFCRVRRVQTFKPCA